VCTCAHADPSGEADPHVQEHLARQQELVGAVLRSLPQRLSSVHSLVFRDDFSLAPTACRCGRGAAWVVDSATTAPATYALIFASTEPQSTELMRAAFGRFSDPRYPPAAREACFGTPFVHSAASGDRLRAT
jgi:hypothetical protein